VLLLMLLMLLPLLLLPPLLQAKFTQINEFLKLLIQMIHSDAVLMMLVMCCC
jgi:hypothetical protein